MYELVVFGTSAGGLRAVKTVLAGLGGSFPLPLVLVQHRKKEAGGLLCELLGKRTTLAVSEALDKEPIRPGRLYVAPADYHLLVEDDHFALSTEAPVNRARPSIDVLFESAARSYGTRLVGVILTGASEDGAAGLAAVKLSGGLAVVQSPASAESPAMPRAALAAKPDQVLPLQRIGPYLARICEA